MGQKVSPIGFRTGIRLDWKSRWFAPKSNYGEFVVEDYRVRDYIDRRLNRQPPYAAISQVEIERTREEVKVTVKTARPGLVIGPRGAEVEKLKEALEDLTNRRVNVNVVEINKPAGRGGDEPAGKADHGLDPAADVGRGRGLRMHDGFLHLWGGRREGVDLPGPVRRVGVAGGAA